MSGLALQYAESYSVALRRWTTDAYDRLLIEVYRVLRPGGHFVFSVNVPEPAWAKVAFCSLQGVVRGPRPVRFLKRLLPYASLWALAQKAGPCRAIPLLASGFGGNQAESRGLRAHPAPFELRGPGFSAALSKTVARLAVRMMALKGAVGFLPFDSRIFASYMPSGSTAAILTDVPTKTAVRPHLALPHPTQASGGP